MEEKQLLLKDLCARQPYGVICSICRIDDWNVGWRDEKLSGYFYNGTSYEFYFGETAVSVDDISKIKPYLRPMSSITKEELKEFNSLLPTHIIGYISKDSRFKIDSGYDEVNEDINLFVSCIDWLNAHYFDYRGLIEKGLALEAPEGMYKNE